MSQDHSVQNISLTPLEISVFTLCLSRNNFTDEERRIFFATMPGRIDAWIAAHRCPKYDLPVTQQPAYLQPES